MPESKPKTTLQIEIENENKFQESLAGRRTEVMKKNDQGKPDLSMIPVEALNENARVLEFGATEYGRDNWRIGTNWTRFGSAMLRHVFAWVGGETNDKLSGCNHLAHAGCCIMFLLYYADKKIGKDDRPELEKTRS